MVYSPTYPVTKGPPKWDLALGLFDRQTGDFRTLTFYANCPLATEILVVVTAVEAEDGSGHAWRILGTAYRVTRMRGVSATSPIPKDDSRVLIHYRTDDLRGHIRFER